MAKRNGNTQASEQAAPKDTPKWQAPEGYQKQSGDVVGYWDPDSGPIHMIPRSAKLFDSQLEKTKPSMLILVELVEACKVSLKKDGEEGEREEIIAKPGDVVGVWGKAGLKDMRDLGGVKVWMVQDGEKHTGKPNPMKLYDIRSAGRGIRIPITEDTREKSAHVVTFLDPPKPGRKAQPKPPAQEEAGDDDDLSPEDVNF